MTPQRRQPLPSIETEKYSPLRGTNNRSRSEALLQCVQSSPKSMLPARSVKDLLSRRVSSNPYLRDNASQLRKDEIEGGSEKFLDEKAVMADGANFLTTPPDRDAVSKLEGFRSVSSSEGTFDKKTAKSCGLSGENLVNSQQSQLKLFWNSNSHCYRRLLPFLIDATKKNSCTLEILPSTSHAKKVDKELKGGSSMSTTLPADNSSSTNSSKKSDDNIVEELCTQSLDFQTHGISYTSPEKVGVTSFPPNVQIIKSQPHLLCSGNENKIKKSTTNGQENEAPQVHPFPLTMDQSHSSHIAEDSLPYMPKRCLSIAGEPLSVQEQTGCTALTSDLHETATSVIDRSQVTLSTSGDDKHIHETLHSRFLGLKRCTSAMPERGILKRQRRGCKGECTCLDCSSFVFHAQKAFEFSKKQMLDAEDVTIGLIKELSFLRRMIIGISGSQGQAVLEHSQVQEICKRSSRAEEMARAHLKEMAIELDIHCRTTNSTHSRVSFAESVEETIIPRSEDHIQK